MNHINYRVSLDMFDVTSQRTIKAKKGDSACKIHITLTENGKIYHISEGCYATFSGKKADGNFVYDNCTIEGNTIVYDFASSADENGICQVSACEGAVECEVTLYKADSMQLTSPRFTLVIDGTVYNGEEIASTPETDVLKTLINDANELVDEIETKLENGEFKGEKGDKGDKGEDADPVGKPTPEGGEIFNDYDNNNAIAQMATASGVNTLAGSKAFKIIYISGDFSEITLYITTNGQHEELVSQLQLLKEAIGDRADVYCSLYLAETDDETYGNNEVFGNFDYCGTIINVNTDHCVITITNVPDFKDVGRVDNRYAIVRIPEFPLIGTEVVGAGASASGYDTQALNVASNAVGYNNVASGKYAHAQNCHNLAGGYASDAMGWSNKALGKASHAEGYVTQATGEFAHSEGTSTKAIGKASHAEGSHGTHSSGQVRNSEAKGESSHSEGKGCYANGEASHAQGVCSIADGKGSFAGGIECYANEEGAFAAGYIANAGNRGCVAIGEGVQTRGKRQTVLGRYNNIGYPWKDSPDQVLVVGIGTSNSDRKNGFEILKDGSAWVLKQGTDDKSVVQKQYVDALENRIAELEKIIGDINSTLASVVDVEE